MFMDESDMLGDVLSQETNDALLVVKKVDDGMYRFEFEGPNAGSGTVDVININGNPCGMKAGSYIDFGGTSTKRVTTTVSDGVLYAYLEVGE